MVREASSSYYYYHNYKARSVFFIDILDTCSPRLTRATGCAATPTVCAPQPTDQSDDSSRPRPQITAVQCNITGTTPTNDHMDCPLVMVPADTPVELTPLKTK